ncbi:MAG: STAS domain-containing protein [Planctomycetaceae bacterium]
MTVVVFGPEFKTINEDLVPSSGEAMMQAAEMDPPLVVVDLDGVEFFSSSFIEMLFRLWSRLNKREGRFALATLSPNCREILEVTNLQRLWKVCPTRMEAIVWLKSPPAV